MKTLFTFIFLISISNSTSAQTTFNNQQIFFENNKRKIIFNYDNKIIKDSSIKNDIGFKQGYKGTMSFGYQIGVLYDRLKFDFINSLQANHYFAHGIGMGYRNYLTKELIVLPIFIDIRINLIKAKTTPFIAFGVGSLYHPENDFNLEGNFTNTSLGVSFLSENNTSIGLGIGYEIHRTKIYYDPDALNNSKSVYQTLEFFMVISF